MSSAKGQRSSVGFTPNQKSKQAMKQVFDIKNETACIKDKGDAAAGSSTLGAWGRHSFFMPVTITSKNTCLLYTSDAADE